jgi:hypothetical protein
MLRNTGASRASRRRAKTTRWWARLGLVALIVAELAVNYARGVAFGQRDRLFYPMYRTRQSLAVALSMLQQPPSSGYQAYAPVVGVLLKSGLYISDQAGDKARRERLLADPATLNAAFAEALRIPIAKAEPAKADASEFIHGNDLGYADFAYLAFRLFGPRVSALYNFYFLLLLVSVAIFIVQFRKRRFMLLVLAVYLAAHLFVIEYITGFTFQTGSVANSRCFSLLGLLPALYLVAVGGTANRMSAGRAVGMCAQAALLAFIVSCRLEAAWEAAMVVVIGGVSAGALFLQRNSDRAEQRARGFRSLYPAAALALMLGMVLGRQSLVAGAAYRHDTKVHPVWDTVLNDLLMDRNLRIRYTGSADVDPDGAACRAVNFQSHSLPYDCIAATDLYGGRAGDYDRAARNIALEILRSRPLAAFAALRRDLADQYAQYMERRPFSVESLSLPVILVLIATYLFAAAGAAAADRANVGWSVVAGAAVAMFSTVTPTLAPSIFAVGSLAGFLIVGFLAFSCCLALLIAAAMRGAFFVSRQT